MKIKLKQVENGWLHRNELKTDSEINSFLQEKRALGFSLKVEIVCQGGVAVRGLYERWLCRKLLETMKGALYQDGVHPDVYFEHELRGKLRKHIEKLIKEKTKEASEVFVKNHYSIEEMTRSVVDEVVREVIVRQANEAVKKALDVPDLIPKLVEKINANQLSKK